MYFKTFTAKSYAFPRDIHERELDIFVREINKREKLIVSACKITDAAIKLNSEPSVVKS